MRFGDYEMEGLPRRHARGRRARRHPAAPAVERPLLPAAGCRLRPLDPTAHVVVGGRRAVCRSNARTAATGSGRRRRRSRRPASRPTTSAGSPPATACGSTRSSNIAKPSPGRWYREYSFELGQGQEWNFGGDRQVCRGAVATSDGGGQQNASIAADVSFTWPNFWQTEWSNRVRPARAGHAPDARRAVDGAAAVLVLQRRAREQRRVRRRVAGVELGYGRNEDGGLQFEAGVGLTVRPGPQWQLSINPSYEREVDTQQYVTTLPGGGRPPSAGATSSRNIDRSTYSAEVRLNYTFKPDLNLDFYARAVRRQRPLRPVRRAGGGAQPAAAAGRSGRHRRSRTATSTCGRSAATWCCAGNGVPGSTLYLVWQQDRETEEVAPHPRVACRHVRLARRPRRQLLRHQSQLLVLAPVVGRPRYG